MKMSRRNNQSGFTLIEVSLAIVIGVIVLAGAITLYNQSKVSAGNSKAQEKVLALATIVEEIAANRGGSYPPVADLAKMWESRRGEDASSSPWGGAIKASVTGTYGNDGTTAFNWTTGSTDRWATTDTASAGVMVFQSGPGGTTVYDSNIAATKSFANFFVGIIPPGGDGAAFVQGGK
ncbi:type II secretion system protein [bacterium]|nr:type II secretion system protein [bacterium]